VVILVVFLLENENRVLTSKIGLRANSVNTSSLNARIGSLLRAAELGSAVRRGSLRKKLLMLPTSHLDGVRVVILIVPSLENEDRVLT
jgi:hypothetical protein